MTNDYGHLPWQKKTECDKALQLGHEWAMVAFTGTAEEERAYKKRVRHKARCKRCKELAA